MSLNDWSLVVFAVTMIYYFSIYFSMFRPPTVGKFLFLILAWILHIGTIAWYGIATGQLGFILIVLFELMIVGFVYTIIERVVDNEDNVS